MNSILTKNDKFYISLLRCVASNSIAFKRKVGAIIGISDDNFEPKIISTGYNRMSKLSPIQNCDFKKGESFVTYDSVFHAEEVAITTALKLTNELNLNKSTIYCTYSPCINCCKLIVLSGIKRLIYIDKHKINFHTKGELNICCQDYLIENNIEIIRVNENTYEIIEHYKPN